MNRSCWIHTLQSSDKVSPLHTFTKKPGNIGELGTFDIGTICDCLDRENKWASQPKAQKLNYG